MSDWADIEAERAGLTDVGVPVEDPRHWRTTSRETESAKKRLYRSGLRERRAAMRAYEKQKAKKAKAAE